MQAAKALASLHICADSPEPSLLANLISTKISCTCQSVIFSIVQNYRERQNIPCNICYPIQNVPYRFAPMDNTFLVTILTTLDKSFHTDFPSHDTFAKHFCKKWHESFCLRFFVLILCLSVNSIGHVEMVSSPNHTFFLGKLDQAINKYSVHILSLVTDNPS